MLPETMASRISEIGTDIGHNQSRQQGGSLNWVSTTDYIIRIKKEIVLNQLGFQILKVPEYYRQPPNQYSPHTWRFGLHNRGEFDVTGSEVVKLSFVAMFKFGDEEDGIKKFCNAVVEDPKAMLVCYGLHEMMPKLDEEEIKQVLAFDALFLAVSIDLKLQDDLRRLWTFEHIEVKNWQIFWSSVDRWVKLVDFDLLRIENQIPFVLIKRAIRHIEAHTNLESEDKDHPIAADENGEQIQEPPSSNQRSQLATPKEGIIKKAIKHIMKKCSNLEHEDGDDPNTGANADPYLEQWMKIAVEIGTDSFMEISEDFWKNAKPHVLKLSQSHHVLDAAHKTICGVDGMQRTSDHDQEDYIHVSSATTLRDSGIKIVGVAGPLCTMSYDKKKKCLSLPKMQMYDETVALVRNLARYEDYSEGKLCMLHDYVLFMLDLIETPKDFKFLSNECGVIDNYCGNRGFELLTTLNQNLTRLSSSKEHNEMKKAIKSRCALRGYGLWSEFKKLFLSRPWLTLSAVAAVLVTVATLIQTYASVIGTNGMKPQFNP